LLEKGAEKMQIEESRKRNHSVLQEAASNGHEAIVRLLLANGAKVEEMEGGMEVSRRPRRAEAMGTSSDWCCTTKEQR
jgi:Ankyrin repeat